MTLREGPFRAERDDGRKGWWISTKVSGADFVPDAEVTPRRRLLEKLEGRGKGAPVVKCDYGDKCPGHASPGDRPCGWAPAKPTKGKPKRKRGRR